MKSFIIFMFVANCNIKKRETILKGSELFLPPLPPFLIFFIFPPAALEFSCLCKHFCPEYSMLKFLLKGVWGDCEESSLEMN